MIFAARHKKITLRTLLVLVIVAVVGYCFLTYTSKGRILGLYLIAGWSAPGDVRGICRDETDERVTEKFTLPLNMSKDAKNALREYWHYSYYRECLFRADYSFMGKPLPETTLTQEGTRLVYTNHLAGIRAEVHDGSTLSRDNELNVDYDYRLHTSVLTYDAMEIVIDLFATHDDIVDHATLTDLHATLVPEYVEIGTMTEATTSSGTPYLYVASSDGQCGWMLYTPHDRILYTHSTCDTYPETEAFLNALEFLPESPSLH